MDWIVIVVHLLFIAKLNKPKDIYLKVPFLCKHKYSFQLLLDDSPIIAPLLQDDTKKMYPRTFTFYK